MLNSTPPISPHLLLNVKCAEGVRLAAYLDTKGIPTIGYGHTQNVKLGDTCTLAQADAWLATDLQEAYTEAAGLPEARGLDSVRLDALAELVFNLGPEKWFKFHKTRAAISDRNWQVARDELLASEWAGEVGRTRSTRIARSLLTGEYSNV